ncbi:MAG TPA: hypothetical protein VFT16_00725 [Candidatus Saccharimonadales bacterium]|nr:hypothetical protein [Candidatus Saccharimonadales bacterium]
MRFLSAGDFNFPFDIAMYWVKHAFIWSFQSGTPNPDGLIRLPGRVFNFIIFALFGNVGVSYFYIFAPLVIAFFAFYFFAKNILDIKSRSAQIVGALFFACNPIFLGNIAKIGLVLAVVMLPFCFLAIQTAFKKRQVRYLLLYILCINISFLHPYTFTVNLAVSGLYFLYMAWQHKTFIADNIARLLLVGVAAIGLNLYFALPMMAMGSVSKDMISTNITPTPIDYTALVGISNTGNFFTGFSLSKNVFVDFAFYDATYQNIYFFGVFLFYVVLLWLLLRVEHGLRPDRRRQLAILLGSFLALIALAATTVLKVDDFIRFLISMPGGWAFRSPLKWQLYIPLVLFGAMAIILAQVKTKRMLRTAQALLMVTFVIMNAYLFLDVYRKILVPRSLENFARLYDTNMDHKTVLFINNGDCMDFMRANPRLVTEMNQVFTSKNTQLKNVLSDNLTAVNLGSYDYLLTCKAKTTAYLEPYDFSRQDTFANGVFRLYRNQHASDRIYSPPQIYGVSKAQDIGKKYAFAADDLGKQFNFAQTDSSTPYPTTGLRDAYGNVAPTDIRDGVVTAPLDREGTGSRLVVRPSNESLYFRTQDDGITFSTVRQPGAQTIGPGDERQIALTGDERAVRYHDPRFDYKNLIRNGSFEDGLWHDKVDDCYDFDNNPDIGMKLDNRAASDGRSSLRLRARQHIACTGPGQIKVEGGGHYLLSFDYQSEGGKYAGYHVSYDDPAKTTDLVRMQQDGQGWRSFSQELAVPQGATRASIKLYAYPHTYGEVDSIVHYDNVSLTQTPAMQNRFYIITDPAAVVAPPKSLTYELVDPTKKTVAVSGATKAFYVADTDSYSPLWELTVRGAKTPVSSSNHIQLNNTMNAWYIDPKKACAENGAACTKNPDGSYDMQLTVSFAPQRWFYIGAFMSGATFVICVIYFVRSRKQPADGQGYRL